jgi:hypothetical protein
VSVREIQAHFATSGPILERYLNTKSRRPFIMGPLGSGKTFTSAMKALKVVTEQAPGPDGVRRTTGLVTRTNFTDLEASALRDWLDLTDGKFQGQLGEFSWASPATHRLRFRLPDQTRVESDIYFLGLDDPDGINKVRGMPLTWAWLNECKDIPFGLITMIYGRCGRYPRMEDGGPTWFGMFGDTNMPYAGHWMYEFAENTHPEGWEFYKQPGGLVKRDGHWVANPDAENLANLPADYYIDKMHGMAEDWVSVFLAANYGFAMDGKPVYPEYVDSTHCREFGVPRGTGFAIRLGGDFGNTPAAMCGWRLPNGAWRWHSELVTEAFGIVRFAEALGIHLRTHYPGVPIASSVGDPSGDVMQSADTEERDVFRILAAHGIKMVPAPTNDPTVRREVPAKYMRMMIDGEPGFLVHPQCKVARIGLAGGFKYRKLRGVLEGLVSAKRDKNMYSHVVEAGEYMMLGAGEASMLMKPMGQVSSGRKRELIADGAEEEYFGLD